MPSKPTGEIMVPVALQPPAPLSPWLVAKQSWVAAEEAARLASWFNTAQSVSDKLQAAADARKVRDLAIGAQAMTAELLATQERTATALRVQLGMEA